MTFENPCGVCGDEPAELHDGYLGRKCYKRLERLYERSCASRSAIEDLRDELQLQVVILELVADPPEQLRPLFEEWGRKRHARRELVAIGGGL